MDAAFRLLEAEYEIDIVKGRKETSAGHKQAFKPFAIGAGLKEQSELDIVLDGKDEDDELHSSETRSYQLFDHYVDADTFSSWWSSFDARLTKVSFWLAFFAGYTNLLRYCAGTGPRPLSEGAFRNYQRL